MIMVHAITKHGPLVSCDSNGIPIQEVVVQAQEQGEGTGRQFGFQNEGRGHGKVPLASQVVERRL